MTDTIQFTISDEKHTSFKIWCMTQGYSMSRMLRDIVNKCLEGFDYEQVISEFKSLGAYRVNVLDLPSGDSLKLPLPNTVREGPGGQLLILVPGDTSDEDISLISTIPNSVVQTVKEWGTEMPLELIPKKDET